MMDLGLRPLGFPLKPSSNASEGEHGSTLMENGVNSINDTSLAFDARFPNHQFFPLNNQSGHVSIFSASPKGVKRKWSAVTSRSKRSHPYGPRRGSDESSGLALGLGPSTSSSDSRVSSGTSSTETSCKDNIEDESSMDLELGIQLQLGNARDASVKKTPVEVLPKSVDMDSGFQLELSLSRATTESEKSCLLSQSDCALGLGQMQVEEAQINMNSIPIVDEGSTSARWKSGGYIRNLLMAPNSESPLGINSKQTSVPLEQHSYPSKAVKTRTSSPKLVTGGTSGVTEKSAHQQRMSSNTKTCQFRGCGKGARGASGLCIAHGGGRRCQKDGCNKGAEGRTVFCKAHGGGRRCQHLGCTKSAEGRTDYCISHGGGRRCSHEGCERAARGKSGLCIRHGGGKRCIKEGCTKSAEGFSGLCISHGGGRRCQFTGCTKGAQGSTMFCKAHGGGKRCMVTGCNKGAEGSTPLCKGHGGGKRCMFEGGGICPKSVHGGTKFCVAHGGGKRCAIQGCTKSARGRTDFCVRHGGGKRCKFENCGKSAQGSTDFCKAHGGGKRCQWGAEGTIYADKVVQGKNGEIIKGPCDRFARGKTGLCAAHSALIQDWRVHGGGTLGSGIGPGLFHGLATGPKSQNASSSHGTLPQIGKGPPSESDSDVVASASALNIGHNGVNDVEMLESREKGKEISEGQSSAFNAADSVEILGNRGSIGGKGYTPYWPAFPHAFMPSVPDGHSFGGTALGRPVIGHCVGQQVPMVSLHSELSVVNSIQPSLIPPQVLVPLSMKGADLSSLHTDNQSGGIGPVVCSALSLPEGRVHGGGLMAMLSRGAGIADLQPNKDNEHNRMGRNGPCM
eukprot:TRINITY_DN42_c0_g1_i1.p1 TRINITY_DN42_c0_g1~~TRINITY_DN42_c0_g1_i1.p1  ORF type:complete len:848 (-),score=137.80 TRINITY_DN42_c0_g1_i1:300-2843(-)